MIEVAYCHPVSSVVVRKLVTFLVSYYRWPDFNQRQEGALNQDHSTLIFYEVAPPLGSCGVRHFLTVP